MPGAVPGLRKPAYNKENCDIGCSAGAALEDALRGTAGGTACPRHDPPANMASRLLGKLQSGEHVPDSSQRAHPRIGLAILPAAHHAQFSASSIDVSARSPGL